MTPAVVTMKTIAARAGVTQATVSMSLANNPRISLLTRERIQAIADELGYCPNPYVSTLMRIRRMGRRLTQNPVLALVCAQHAPDGWRNHPSATIRQMREGAVERATACGYRVQEFWLHRDGISGERFSEMLRTRSIHALLIGPSAEGAAMPTLKWDYFSAVGLSVPLPSSTLTTICNDHYFGSLQAVRECHRRGYLRPGIVLQRLHQERFQGRWLAGYLAAAQELPGLALPPPLLLDGADDRPLWDWLRREQPDVLITPSADPIARSLAEHGCRVPADLGVALLACPARGHPYSGVYQNGAYIGALAIDTLIAMVERHERGLPEQAKSIMVEGLWNEGETLRPAA